MYVNFIYRIVPQGGKYHPTLKVYLMKMVEAWRIVFCLGCVRYLNLQIYWELRVLSISEDESI